MSRIRSFARRPSPLLRVSRAVLVAANVALLAWAVWLDGAVVTDGEGTVTTGFVVAAGIAATLLAVALAGLLRLPAGLVLKLQVFALAAQALHAVGHLARLYYLVWFYDDLLHFGLVFLVGILALELARARGFLFSFRAGPLRVAVLVWIVATAAAGLWEIFEFAMDVLMRTREQDDLSDTMIDMVDGTLGGALAGLVAWREVRAERRAKQLANARSDELLD